MRLLFTIVIAALSLNAVGQIPNYVSTDGLVAWFTFNGNFNDISGNGNHGQNNGASFSTDRFGNDNSAGLFNGTSSYVSGVLSGLNSTSESSVSVWILSEGDAGGQPYDLFFQLGNYGQHTFAYAYNHSGQNVDLYSHCFNNPYSTLNINNAWHHLVIVDGSNSTSLYVDGALFQTWASGNGGECYRGSNAFLIGGGADSQFTTGKLDEVGFWDRVLTAEDVVNLFNASPPEPIVQGCTDNSASNYNPSAIIDDGSCLYIDCMDSTACNYNPDATEDDGSCDYSCCPGPGCCHEGTYWDDDTQQCYFNAEYCGWQPDSNSDGLIGIGDLLDLLSVFGDTDYDEDGVFDSVDDCLDLEACNYAANPTEPCGFIDALGECGGGCEADTDGDAICDDIDDCIGVVDECGVCNGPGATEIVIESITILYDSLYAEQIDEWWVFEIGADTVFNYTCAPYFGDCGDLVSHDGYDYSTVQIGDQCWFSENCRYLPEVSPLSASSTSDPYYYVYDYEGTDVTAAQATSNYETYGVLYNWPAVMIEGICPSGWHIPSDGEFTQLTDFLGGESVAGHAMKSTSGWNNNGNGSNSSGFTGLAGGYSYSGGFDYGGSQGLWWSASESGSFSWGRRLYSSNGNVQRGDDGRYYGFSARCVRD